MVPSYTSFRSANYPSNDSKTDIDQKKKERSVLDVLIRCDSPGDPEGRRLTGLGVSLEHNETPKSFGTL